MMVKSIRFSCTLQLCRSWPKHGDQWGSHCKDQAQATAITRCLHSSSWTPISPFLLNNELFTETEVERGSSCCCEGKWQLMAVTWAWSLEHEPYWCLCFDHNQESWSVSLITASVKHCLFCTKIWQHFPIFGLGFATDSPKDDPKGGWRPRDELQSSNPTINFDWVWLIFGSTPDIV